MVSTAVIGLEQEHFDRAWEAREETRGTLSGARQSAAGSQASSRAVGKSAKEMLAKLGEADEAVAFARFDDEQGEVLYLGKHAITDPNRDLLVINWQAPAAAPYFEATYDDTCGLARRRKFQTDRNKVLDFEEVVFKELADAVSSLTESQRTGVDDTVLRDLEQDRTGEMQDIVQTIHAAQYELIRTSADQLLIIQGGPGTGKTAVGLHRVSWMLFNQSSAITASDVLVIGPNPTFTRYIRTVLPSLGDSDVQHLDLRGLGPQGSNGREESADVARLKGEERMATLLEVALGQRIRFPANQAVIEISGAGAAGRLEREVVEPQLERFRRNMRNYSGGRSGFRGWIANQVGPSGAPVQIDAAVERIWPSLTAQRFLVDLFGSRDRLVAAGGDLFTGSSDSSVGA